MHGEKAYGIPVALHSRAVAAPILFIRCGSLNIKSPHQKKFNISLEIYIYKYSIIEFIRTKSIAIFIIQRLNMI